MSLTLEINGQRRECRSAPETPLLWVLRDELGLTGTKFGCGMAQCGACTVHVAGAAMRSCVMPVVGIGAQPVTTIEALGESARGRALQDAWVEHQVPQCGYCQSGMLMAAAHLLAQTPRPSDAEIDGAITNLCRCGSYPRVRRAIHSAAERLHAGTGRS